MEDEVDAVVRETQELLLSEDYAVLHNIRDQLLHEVLHFVFLSIFCQFLLLVGAGRDGHCCDMDDLATELLNWVDGDLAVLVAVELCENGLFLLPLRA